jgi:hypothetical protein
MLWRNLMSRRLIAILLLGLILASLLAPAALASDPATRQVGLVIAFPDGTTHLEIVTVPEKATTFDVLKAARITLTTQDTAYGTSICKINTTGCSFPAEPCFCKLDPALYWAYYHLDPTANRWVAALEGVSTHVPADRAVEGFAWSGVDENWNPTVQPPVYTFDQIVAATTQPVPVPEPGTFLLLGGGLAGVAAYVRLRRSR